MPFDLIIIGGGPAGYVAAERAGHAGLSVLLIEKRSVGGVCLNEGCIPSKALLYCAKAYDTARHGSAYGFSAEQVVYDHGAVIARKDKVVKALVRGVERTLKLNNVQILKDKATIEGKDEDGFLVRVGEEVFSCNNLLIATGSKPVFPPVVGLQSSITEGFSLTNREILDLKEVPSKLVIVGGGVIGLEMAAYYSVAGSKVDVVEMLDHIAGTTDSDISSILQSNLSKAGVTFHLNSRVTNIENGEVVFATASGVETLHADKVLISVGRRPCTANFGLETLDLEMDRFAIKTDSQMRTSIPGLFAAGDVNGKLMLAHTASREAEVAVNTILGIEDVMRYDFVPEVVYTNPEIASVGLKEADAVEQTINFKVIKMPMGASGRYVAEGGQANGICKVIMDPQKGRILGISMISPYASEIIYGMSIALEQGMTIEKLKRVVFPHPTVGEAIRESLFLL